MNDYYEDKYHLFDIRRVFEASKKAQRLLLANEGITARVKLLMIQDIIYFIAHNDNIEELFEEIDLKSIRKEKINPNELARELEGKSIYELEWIYTKTAKAVGLTHEEEKISTSDNFFNRVIKKYYEMQENNGGDNNGNRSDRECVSETEGEDY